MHFHVKWLRTRITKRWKLSRKKHIGKRQSLLEKGPFFGHFHVKWLRTRTIYTTPMLLYGKYTTIVLVLMHVEILSTHWYACTYCIVVRMLWYTFYTVVCMYLCTVIEGYINCSTQWYASSYGYVMEGDIYCSTQWYTGYTSFYLV